MKFMKKTLALILALVTVFSCMSLNASAALKATDLEGLVDVQKLIGPKGYTFLGYRYEPDGNYYYCNDRECWQRGTGYNEYYDLWASVACMFIDQVRIRFQYGGENWMLQLWKGQYGWLLLGAEIGLYNCTLDEYSGETGECHHFKCASEENWLKMQLDCYYAQGGMGSYKKIFTRPYNTYWWATGFVKGQLQKYSAPRTELKTLNRITCKDATMANLLVQGLKVAGFRRGDYKDKNGLADDCYDCIGNDVYILWSTINHDCFVGYNGVTKSFTETDPSHGEATDENSMITKLINIINVIMTALKPFLDRLLEVFNIAFDA